jgi:hypothetical protein
MPRPDEGLIHAWLDGELSPEETARVDELVRSEPAWSAAAAEARGLIAASSRILGALDDVPGGVIPDGVRAGGATPSSLPAGRPRVRFTVRPWMRAAAGIVLVAGTTVAVQSVRHGPAASAPAPVGAVATADTADMGEQRSRARTEQPPLIRERASGPSVAPRASAERTADATAAEASGRTAEVAAAREVPAAMPAATDLMPLAAAPAPEAAKAGRRALSPRPGSGSAPRAHSRRARRRTWTASSASRASPAP